VQTTQKTFLRAPLVCIQVGSAEKFADFNAYYYYYLSKKSGEKAVY
jgi:hypothetical protein